MGNRSIIRKIIIILVALASLSGCAEYFLKPYGYIASDAINVRKDGRAIFLPEGAPTIAQGFNPSPSDGSEPKPGAGHEGIDIYAKTGTPVLAPASGTVTESYFEPLYGNHIVIEHGRDENGRIIHSNLLHLDTRLVNKGDKVSRGRQIGTLGSTGILASYPHLHYEIRIRKNRYTTYPVNPHKFWVDGPGIVTCFDNSIEIPERPFSTTYPVTCLK